MPLLDRWGKLRLHWSGQNLTQVSCPGYALSGSERHLEAGWSPPHVCIHGGCGKTLESRLHFGKSGGEVVENFPWPGYDNPGGQVSSGVGVELHQ